MSAPILGIALGSGAARGWAHIGVLKALAARGLSPQVVAGASIGALVGAAAATKQVDKLEDWVRALSRTDVLKLLDARFRGGVIEGNRVMAAIEDLLSDGPIEGLDARYGAVATDLRTGREIWLREGSLIAAVRASCALPGLFPPVRRDGRWLVDGGLVNPVPVSLCYALGADVVIAVNLNAHRRNHISGHKASQRSSRPSTEEQGYLERFASLFDALRPSSDDPSLLEVLSAAVNIMQERITRSRLAGEPPAVEVTPRVDLELMDFHRADEAIEAGEQAVAAAAAALDDLAASLHE